MPLASPTTKKCSRCRRTDGGFEGILNTCDRCREYKARYQRTPQGRRVYNESKRKWRKTPNGKRLTLAHVYVGLALRRGKLSRQPCEVCGDLNVEGHHDDHDKRLEVRWLCKPHHRKQHNAVV